MTALYACTSHLLVDLPLFGGPVLFVMAAVALVTRRERHRAARDDASSSLVEPWGGGEDPVVAGGRG